MVVCCVSVFRWWMDVYCLASDIPTVESNNGKFKVYNISLKTMSYTLSLVFNT
jgi:hypothetical protein